MDQKSMNRQFTIGFIEIYKRFPCLWRIKSQEYRDKSLKNKAYNELLKKMKEADSNATVQTVKNKIDSMRGSFRKELKKIKSSQRSGAGEEDIYKPRLWYFDQLAFLRDQKTPISSLDRDELTEYNTTNTQSDSSDIECLTPLLAIKENNADAEETCTTGTHSLNQYDSDSSTSSRPKQKRKVNRAEDVLKKVAHQFVLQKEDKFDIVGKLFANKLRELPTETAIVTEKLINDILFEAQMGNVNRYSKAIIEDSRPVPVATYKQHTA